MPRNVQALLDRYYPQEPGGWRFRDGTRPLYEWLIETVNSDAVLLNLGAGPTPTDPTRLVRGRFAQVVGVDVDPIVLTNADLDEAFISHAGQLPFGDSTFDAAFSDWTLEHVAEPEVFLSEVARVIKPGGSFFFRTPNRLHYVQLAAYATPHWFHTLVANRARRLSADAHAPWPTHYRLNTTRTLNRQLHAAGFGTIELKLVESYPSYLMFSPAAFLLGVAYERAVNSSELLEQFRQIIIGRASLPLSDKSD